MREAGQQFTAYRVQLETFEGPLDLLLYLIKGEKIDIYDIPIERIADQYLAYVRAMQELNLEAAGEFLVLAATLMLIKSRMLLPKPPPVRAEEEPEEDPRAELVRMLLEYRQYKEVAQTLRKMAEAQRRIFPHPPVEDGQRRADLRPVSLVNLLDALQAVLERAKFPSLPPLERPRVTLAQKIRDLLVRLARESPLRFPELLSTASSKLEIIVTFLAVLELVRTRCLIVVQREPFAELLLYPRRIEPHEPRTAP
ncbi:MAG TPA: hypothetical protein EYP85_16795 [Armatimonadetes bacterium]|nr:hypothetical protein [Armatimonadota bacterium]